MITLPRALALLATPAFAGLMTAAAPLAPQEQDPAIPPDKDPKTTDSGLKYSVLEPGGDGRPPNMGDKVRVHYTGWLPDGEMFDSSRQRGEPAEFVLGRVIPGWNEGLQLMAPGARYKLTIPPDLAYGESGRPPRIPGNSTLIFDVELLGVPFRAPEFPKADDEEQKTTESGLQYTVLTGGAGEEPEATDVVEFEFALFKPDGELLDCSGWRGQPLKGKPQDFQLPFMKEGLTKMKPGGVWRFEVPEKLGFPQGSGAPSGATVWRLELLRVVEPLTVPEFVMPGDEQLKTTDSGLKYQVVEEGDSEGVSPEMGQRVTVHYAGWLTDGTLFDSSYQRGDTASFQLGRVIPGWNEGLQLMKPGAVYRFVIPPDLAYGKQGSPPKIGPDATLVFQVKLVEVGGS